MRRFKKFVFTGGRCSGKTTTLLRAHERFTALGYKVFLCPEMATPLIMGGAKPWEMNASEQYAFQSAMVRCQLAYEEAFERLAEHCQQPAIIICDRGVFDGAAFHDPWFPKTGRKTDFEGNVVQFWEKVPSAADVRAAIAYATH